MSTKNIKKIPTKKRKISRSKYTHKKRTYKKKGGKTSSKDHPPRKHIKVVTYSSRVDPKKPYYKVFVFDEVNRDIVKAFNDYVKKTVNETEEELIAMRDNYNNNSDNTKKVSVYGFEMIPTIRKK